jgi:hypothetical protein
MTRDYRCYLLDEAHPIKKVEIIECRDDGEAERRAEEISRRANYSGVEVSDLERRVRVRMSSVS